ncbi:MAG: cation-efflux pump [Actinomycetota bacterium]|nr:cation-efflux pump [Actinomycetota bacterium]
MAATQGDRAARVAGVALAVTVVLTIAKLVVWSLTSSLAVLSQALDSVLDILALSLVTVGIRIARRPADEKHQYGHGKAENLVAFTQTLLLGAVVITVAWAAIGKLGPEPSDAEAPWFSFALLGASAVIDLARVAVMTRVARAERSEALRAGALNLATDVGTALVVLLSLVLVRAGVDDADAIGALAVAVAVAVAAVRLGLRSVDVLMDTASRRTADEIALAAARAPGVAETRRVRVRGYDQLFADVIVAAGGTSSLERAHAISEDVEREIARVLPGTDVIVHVEPASSRGLVERVQAAASRVDGVSEIHNVLVHAFQEHGENKLHATLHAKVEPGTPLQEAHAISDLLEDAIADELGRDVRVDTHLEPRDQSVAGIDVTAQRADLVAAVQRAAADQPDVIDCHEVVLIAAGERLSVVAHVHARGDLPLERIHEASVKIEKKLHADHQEISDVVIHFEPETL